MQGSLANPLNVQHVFGGVPIDPRIQTVALNDFISSPRSNHPVYANGDTAVLSVDSWGQLSTRGTVLTDEGSFRDEFVGSSLLTAITGTLTFVAGDTSVTGVGTLFLTEIDEWRHIKLDSDPNTAWTRIARIIDDTHLELVEGYLGTSGSGASSSQNWQDKTLSGGSNSVATGHLNLVVNTNSGAISSIERDVDYAPLVLYIRGKISQRIANQTARFGLYDISPDDGTPNEFLEIVFDGTDNTKVKFVTGAGSSASDQTSTTLTLPAGATTDNDNDYYLELGLSGCTLSINGVIMQTNIFNIPRQYTVMICEGSMKNDAGAASGTTFSIHTVNLFNVDSLQITNIFKGDSIPVTITNQAANAVSLGVSTGKTPTSVTGQLTTTATTADQVVVTRTVTAGKVFYIQQVDIHARLTSIAGTAQIYGNASLEVGAGTKVWTDNLAAQTADRAVITFAEPYPVASGTVVRVVCTPDAAASRLWNANIIGYEK